jgi:hypothetical protein
MDSFPFLSFSLLFPAVLGIKPRASHVSPLQLSYTPSLSQIKVTFLKRVHTCNSCHLRSWGLSYTVRPWLNNKNKCLFLWISLSGNISDRLHSLFQRVLPAQKHNECLWTTVDRGFIIWIWLIVNWISSSSSPLPGQFVWLIPLAVNPSYPGYPGASLTTHLISIWKDSTLEIPRVLGRVPGNWVDTKSMSSYATGSSLLGLEHHSSHGCRETLASDAFFFQRITSSNTILRLSFLIVKSLLRELQILRAVPVWRQHF